ncbi:MAG: TIGR00730 family Rossman fold protein [Boseongicola sp.]|nr:TIGR00730 family Rossman fold protein [Boseongicola sp.]NNL18311.1 TIGR00730 family Rossman fold protein [Boseongicola sp.]
MTPFSVCVYCGSRPGADPAYLQAAKDTGDAIASQGWRLVYGAGDVGLMGAVAQSATDAGAPTLGVIPTHLLDREAPRGIFGDRIITETMHERKKVMFMNADAVVVLPGGAGSLDEFFEVLTWAQLGLHAKPIVLLNVRGYWEPLVALIGHVIEKGFADASIANYFHASSTVEDTINYLNDGQA